MLIYEIFRLFKQYIQKVINNTFYFKNKLIAIIKDYNYEKKIGISTIGDYFFKEDFSLYHDAVHYEAINYATLKQILNHLKFKKDEFTVSEWAQDRVLSLPMYPEITREQVAEVTEAIKAFVEDRSL